MQIENTDKPFDIEVKRFYFPAVLRANCPICGKECIKNGNGDYLSFPRANTPIKVYFYCQSIVDDKDVEHEFTEEIILRVTVEAVKRD
jgi:hypothetical protein